MMTVAVRQILSVVLISTIATVSVTAGVQAQARETVTIRGQAQSLRLYGTRGGIPVIVSSGDGGWIHLGPHVAEVLAGNGFFVVGFDVKAYLEHFTSGNTTLRPEDEPGDYDVLADFAARGTRDKPILIGVSEGAGLSVLAATDDRVRTEIAGVLGLGLSDVNELGWRWKDALIYLTRGVPTEPTFRVSAIVDRMSPLPLGVIQSTHDEFVPIEEVRHVLERAHEPKRLWTVEAEDHRFCDNLAGFDRCLLEAIRWMTQRSPR
jgi:fermentation-respiration switch protein FrsA (DUF1100 family)